jgi:hypothetical protein
MNPLVGHWYAFWSGIGNDIPIYVIGVVPLWWTTYRRHNCHVRGCWRFGHIDPAVHAPACSRHHTLGHLHGKEVSK